MLRTLSHLVHSRGGNIATFAAFVLPLMVFSIGLGVDYAYLSLQRRQLQSVADLTAIVAASDLANREKVVLNHMKTNGLSLLLQTPSGLLDAAGKAYPQTPAALARGVVTLQPGRYAADPKIKANLRFVKDAAPADAVQVTIRKQADLFVARIFAKPPVLQTTGMAEGEKVAAFSIGSRLASLNGGLLNSLLGNLLGTTVTLKVMDYNALLDADISIRPFLKALAIDLNLTAGTYDDVLTADVTLPQLMKAMRQSGGLPAPVGSALKQLQDSTSKTSNTFKVGELLNIDPKGSLRIDAGSNWKMSISALQMISAAASLANGKNQIALDAGIGLPGLLSVKLALAIGEPPVETPSHRLDIPGTAVRTAQTRLALNVEVAGLAAIAGIKVEVPLYIEIAFAEAQLADILCYGGDPENAAVHVDTVPGIAEIAIGKVNPKILSDFSKDVRVEPATLLQLLFLLSIEGKAHIETKNMDPVRLKFSPQDIEAKKIKSVSTKDILTSLTQTLLGELDLNIKLLGLGLPSLKALQQALAQTLSAVTPQIDELLYNILLLVGVRVGEADVRVTGVACQPPALVQ